MKKMDKELFEKVAGGVGEPIYRDCPKCGKTFKAGNIGVDLNRYPLKEICDECARNAE